MAPNGYRPIHKQMNWDPLGSAAVNLRGGSLWGLLVVWMSYPPIRCAAPMGHRLHLHPQHNHSPRRSPMGAASNGPVLILHLLSGSHWDELHPKYNMTAPVGDRRQIQNAGQQPVSVGSGPVSLKDHLVKQLPVMRLPTGTVCVVSAVFVTDVVPNGSCFMVMCLPTNQPTNQMLAFGSDIMDGPRTPMGAASYGGAFEVYVSHSHNTGGPQWEPPHMWASLTSVLPGHGAHWEPPPYPHDGDGPRGELLHIPAGVYCGDASDGPQWEPSHRWSPSGATSPLQVWSPNRVLQKCGLQWELPHRWLLQKCGPQWQQPHMNAAEMWSPLGAASHMGVQWRCGPHWEPPHKSICASEIRSPLGAASQLCASDVRSPMGATSYKGASEIRSPLGATSHMDGPKWEPSHTQVDGPQWEPRHKSVLGRCSPHWEPPHTRVLEWGPQWEPSHRWVIQRCGPQWEPSHTRVLECGPQWEPSHRWVIQRCGPQWEPSHTRVLECGPQWEPSHRWVIKRCGPQWEPSHTRVLECGPQWEPSHRHAVPNGSRLIWGASEIWSPLGAASHMGASGMRSPMGAASQLCVSEVRSPMGAISYGVLQRYGPHWEPPHIWVLETCGPQWEPPHIWVLQTCGPQWEPPHMGCFRDMVPIGSRLTYGCLRHAVPNGSRLTHGCFRCAVPNWNCLIEMHARSPMGAASYKGASEIQSPLGAASQLCASEVQSPLGAALQVGAAAGRSPLGAASHTRALQRCGPHWEPHHNSVYQKCGPQWEPSNPRGPVEMRSPMGAASHMGAFQTVRSPMGAASQVGALEMWSPMGDASHMGAVGRCGPQWEPPHRVTQKGNGRPRCNPMLGLGSSPLTGPPGNPTEIGGSATTNAPDKIVQDSQKRAPRAVSAKGKSTAIVESEDEDEVIEKRAHRAVASKGKWKAIVESEDEDDLQLIEKRAPRVVSSKGKSKAIVESEDEDDLQLIEERAPRVVSSKGKSKAIVESEDEDEDLAGQSASYRETKNKIHDALSQSQKDQPVVTGKKADRVKDTLDMKLGNNSGTAEYLGQFDDIELPTAHEDWTHWNRIAFERGNSRIFLKLATWILLRMRQLANRPIDGEVDGILVPESPAFLEIDNDANFHEALGMDRLYSALVHMDTHPQYLAHIFHEVGKASSEERLGCSHPNFRPLPDLPTPIHSMISYDELSWLQVMPPDDEDSDDIDAEGDVDDDQGDDEDGDVAGALNDMDISESPDVPDASEQQKRKRAMSSTFSPPKLSNPILPNSQQKDGGRGHPKRSKSGTAELFHRPSSPITRSISEAATPTSSVTNTRTMLPYKYVARTVPSHPITSSVHHTLDNVLDGGHSSKNDPHVPTEGPREAIISDSGDDAVMSTDDPTHALSDSDRVSDGDSDSAPPDQSRMDSNALTDAVIRDSHMRSQSLTAGTSKEDEERWFVDMSGKLTGGDLMG
ncbi:hypothetical protein DEU56DRAFT_756341 [Suillus clintonianus]|uniref:uncharacterized protein n=1 Tax=Suillus clintonianus TaxID=1904413 RepID=UPI001B872493|nr:uncharacterized protein DEU56DRAFT_756341 [Suillus clintonianus]KAG2136435.1 hypothetical protein DEU56DRAFT_756341 [Suillus clintonianus]